MAKQSPTVFLEEWLQSNSRIPTLSAQAIIQTCADLRDLLQRKVSLPPESYPFFLRLLYVWVRKSSRHSPLLITSVFNLLLQLFSRKFDSTRSSSFLSEGVLLLGSLSFSFNASEKSKTSCLELLYKVLEEDYVMIGSSDSHMHCVLAGIGYALSSSVQAYHVEILDLLFGMWNKKDGPSANVSQGLMILHLIEWVLSNNINSKASDKINLLRMEAFQSRKPAYATFATHGCSRSTEEAGVVTRVLCNFYASADEETMIWDFCQHIYIRHRQAALVLQGQEGMLLTDLEKIDESAFLMVVVFALTVTKHRLNHRIAPEIQQQLSVKILISSSCMEYFRRMRLAEYLDTIRAVIISIQENESACISFVESMRPSLGFSKLLSLQPHRGREPVVVLAVLPEALGKSE
ncbi:hypothetical protein LIER_34860 [Lithospermum erythrorhizon]|uniref:Uncharacterized protein n=1 Tax=Lithospermum erythrorhizon TaxID=34254 RepID=A0AAV3S3V0_LITER